MLLYIYTMETVQQPSKLKVENFDEQNQSERRRHGKLFPNQLRVLIAGPSGAGKTNILLSLIFEKHGVSFENIYIYSKTIDQPKYKLLKDVIKPLKGIDMYMTNDLLAFPSTEEVKQNSLVIFDDVNANSDQEVIKNYYSRGRHKKLDMFFLIQTYSAAHKQNLRDNCNVIILLKQDTLNLRHVFDNHVIGDMSFEKFCTLCGECWNNKYGFIVTDKEFELNNGRYRCGFDKFIIINT